LILALGLPGAIVALIERRNGSWFLALYLGLYALSILFFFVTSVYRLPLAPVLIVFAAYGVVKFVECIRDKIWLHVVLYSVMAVAIFLFAIWLPAGASKEAGFGQSYFRYGKYYFEQSEFRQAITYFNKSIAAKPDNSRALLMLGISYQLEGMEREALDTFGQALAADPESPQANYYFGLSLFNAGDYKGAVGYLERSAQLAPDNPDTWDKLGAVYVRGNDYNGARLAYSQLVELQPNNSAAHQRLAEVLMQLGYAGEAVNESTVALKLNPGQAGANLLLGRYYWGTGELQLAEEYLLREIENSPEFLPAYFFIADFYMDTGRPENAVRYYAIYRENGGQPDEKLEILLQ
jgi:tetratricopeptide (TPR) repeat protein